MRLSLAFCFVRKVVCGCLFCALAVPVFAAEGHASFAASLGGNMAPVGLPGFESSPARLSEPSFGAFGYWASDVDEWSLGAMGEMMLHSHRMAFVYLFHAMDSLYRSSYSELQFAWNRNWLVLGVAYGLDINWIPGADLWTRHRMKAAVDLKWRDFHFAGMLKRYTDDRLEEKLGFFWDGNENVRLFAESDFEVLMLGFDFLWKQFSLRTSYRFPSFSVAVSVNLNINSYGLFYSHGFASNSLGWNGGGFCRKIKK